MSTTTENYALIKPELTDAADITAFNKNWDVIDTKLLDAKKHTEDKNNPHGVTIEQIGAAPTGYGLGTASISINNLNTCITNGWYWTGATTLNVPDALMYSAVHVSTRLDGQVVQTLTSINKNIGCQMLRTTTDKGVTWIEEWVNPPMAVNVEYRTTERYMGKVVYTKIVSFTEGDYVSGTFDVDGGKIISWNAQDGSFTFPTPVMGDNYHLLNIYTSGMYEYLQGGTNAGRTGICYVHLRYTK